ncbi:SitI3 family protein [Paenibacillus sp. FSL H8-0048]|uniref:SitI3 family protein n=1 Tax=Paenibacillus sp. FSL H8-0048 TaxID=2954508 RepID=UPI0030FA9222
MALEYSFMLEEIQLSNTDISIELEKLGVILDVNKIEKMSEGVRITETYDRLGFSLTLMDTSKSLYGYESEYFLDEFINRQDLSFRINKFFEWEKAIVNMLTIVFEIMDKVSTNCIFEFNGDTVYLVRLNEVIYINNNTGFWDNENFKEIIKRREFLFLKPNEKL